VGAACFPAALLLFVALRYTVGLRVGRDEEMGGLDVGEHGMEAYGGFQIFPDH
jgi:Amt family ammonium transporter